LASAPLLNRAKEDAKHAKNIVLNLDLEKAVCRDWSNTIVNRERGIFGIGSSAAITQFRAREVPENEFASVGEKLGIHCSAVSVSFISIDVAEHELTILYEWTEPGREAQAGVHDLDELFSDDLLRVLAGGSPVITADVEHDLRFERCLSAYTRRSVRSAAVVPYLSGGSLAFALSVYKTDRHKWHSNEVNLLRNAAESVFLEFERAQTRAALDRAVRFDEVVLGNMGEGLYTTDQEGALITMNPAAEQLLGWTIEELRGRRMHEIIHNKHRDGTPIPNDACKIFQVLKTGNAVVDIDDEFVRKDGTFLDVRYTSSPLVDSGHVIGLVVVFRDVRERRQIESRIRESEARLRAMFSQAGVGVCLIGADCLIEQVNPKFCEIVGYDESELAGRSCLAMTCPDDLRENLRVMGGLIETEAETASLENRYIRRDGTTVWVRINLAKIPDSTRKITQLVAVVEDINERKLAEERLRESEQRFARFMQHLPGLAWIKDGDGRYLYANEAAETAFGVSGDKLYGKTDAEVFPPEIAAAFTKNDRKALASESGVQIIETLRTKTGGPVESLVTKFSISGDTDQKPMIGGMAIDVTEQRQIQRDQEFLFAIADKIRTSTDAADLLSEIPQLLGRFLNVHRCLFNEIDLESDIEVVHSDYSRTGESVAGTHRISDYSPVTSEMMMSGKTVVNRDSKLDPRTAKLYETTYGPSKESAYVTVPMLRNGKWVASLWCSDDRPRNWTDREIALLENIAERTWSAVDRLRSQEALRANTERLRESEERFRLATEAVRGVIYDWDIPNDRIERSGEIERLLGFSHLDPAIATNQWWLSRVHPDDLEEVRSSGDAAIASGAARWEGEYRIRHRAGHYVWVNDTGLLIRDDGGPAVRCVGSVIEITERKRAEEALRESEQRFRQTSDAAPVLIWMSDTAKQRTWFNKSWLDFTGRTMNEELGAGWADGVHPDDLERCLEIHGRSFEARIEFSMEYRLRRADGQYRWILDTGVPRFSAGNEFLGYIGSCVDIHDRKVAENASREATQRLSATYELAPVGIIERDASLKYIGSNQRFTEITGYDRDQLASLGMADLVHPGDIEIDLGLHKKLMAGEIPSYQIQVRFVKPDGTIVWCDVFRTAVLDAEGKPAYSIGAITDVTERKWAAEALRESEERFNLAQSAGNVGVWDWDIGAQRTYWSDTMWRFYGEDRRSVNPDDAFWSAHLHPDDRDRVKEKLERTIASSDLQYRDEFRIIGAEGRTIWIESMANVIRRSDGKAIRVYGVNLDITERRLNEERIRRNETQLRLVTDSLPALIAYIDHRKRYQFVNRTYSEWFGEEPADMIGKPIKDVVGVRAYRSLKPHIEKALAGKPVSLHAEIPYKNVGTKFVHINYVPDTADDGIVRGVFSLISDFTETKRSEELLRSTEERIALVMENVADYAIFSISTEGVIESWNMGAEKIFGYSAEEILGKSGEILFTAEDIAKGVHFNEMRIARQKGRATDERWHVRKDGSRFFASGVMMPLIVGKRLTGYAKIASDLTEKKRRAEELQSAHDELELRVFQRTKELAETNELLRHEVEQRKLSEKQRVKLLHRIVSAQEAERRSIARDIHDQLGQRITALRLKLASLRDISSDGEIAGRVERLQEIAALLDSEVSFLASELRPSILDDLGLEEALRAYAKDWSNHFDIHVKFFSNGRAGKRYGRESETQVYRIVQEALNNVAKHAGPAEVAVMMEQTIDFLVLIIEDNGSGFDIDDRRIKSKKGLGLVGMKERATLIGADLEIESSAGQGTTIFLRLPNRKRGQTNGG
jgi:PAS domain S-box-containing protein